MLFSRRIDQSILFRSTGDEEGEVFPNFVLFSYFSLDVQPELADKQ